MLTGFILAAAPATAASLPAATSAASQPEGLSTGELIMAGIFFAWLVLAGGGLLNVRFFSGVPLLKAPPRTAIGLLPLALGTFALYIVFTLIAIYVGIAAGYIAHLPEPPAQLPAAISRPASNVTLPAGSAATPASSPSTTSAATMASATAATSASAGASTSATPSPAAQPEDAADPIQNMRQNVLLMGAELAAIVAAVFACRRLFVEGLRGIGLSPKQLVAGVLLGALCFFMLEPFILADTLVAHEIYSRYHHDFSTHQTIAEMRQAPSLMVQLVLAVIAGCGAPVAEEIFFRGLLQTALIQRGWGVIFQFPADRTYRPSPAHRWTAILICSAAFAATHVGNPDHMPVLFLLAVGMGYLYERTGNLWAAITVHALFNWTSLVQVLTGG